jgi:hypothetical protein
MEKPNLFPRVAHITRSDRIMWRIVNDVHYEKSRMARIGLDRRAFENTSTSFVLGEANSPGSALMTIVVPSIHIIKIAAGRKSMSLQRYLPPSKLQ